MTIIIQKELHESLCKEFIEYTKTHKHEIDPNVPCSHPLILEDKYTCYLDLAITYNAFEFVFNMFYDTIDPNLNTSNYENYNCVMERLMSFHDKKSCVMLASHPRFNIVAIIYRYAHRRPEFCYPLEHIIALANPEFFKKSAMDWLYRGWSNPLCIEYALDPHATRTKMYKKHFSVRDACRVFVTCLLLENKIFNV